MRNDMGTAGWSWWPNATEVPRFRNLANSSDSDSWNGLAFKIRDEIHAVVEALERVARAVEDSGRVVEPLVEQVAPAHQPDLAAQADVGREQRPLGRRQPVIRDRVLVIGERREEAAESELETVVEVQIDEGVQNVDRAAQAPVDRELVLDPLGDVAVEEDPLAGQEQAAIGRDLVALTPDSCIDLGLEVELKPKLLVLGLELEARCPRCPSAATSCRCTCSRPGIPVRACRGKTAPRCSPAPECPRRSANRLPAAGP